MAQSPCSFLPLAPFSIPLLLTWHPPSCDRNRSPRSQVGDKLNPQWVPQVNGEGVAQSGGAIPAPLGFISPHTNPFYIVH